MSSYRDRIYRSYVHARNETLVPASTEGFRPRAPYLRKLVREHFPADRNAAILDLGCGHGALLYFAQQEGYRNISGIDHSPEQVAEALRLGISGVSEGDLLTSLGRQADQSVDVVVAFDVIEHLTKEELLLFVDEVYRVLRVGGRWVIHTVNGGSPFCSRMLYRDATHELAFTELSLSQVLLSSGFRNAAFYEDTPVPHGFKSSIRWIFWRMIRSVLQFYIAVETGAWERKSIFTQCFLAVTIK